ncbi:integrase [Actinocorallia longicatena]|uniref:Protein phosphatase 2C domain-containing protein n=1 Tax=Actinocorallia longicatena TaxID=111803 RepID=A0ABP6QEY4_9ACTN
MRITVASEPGRADRENEDFAGAVPGAALVVDGATAPPGVASGCVHSVAWYARTLGGLLLGTVTDLRLSLAEALELAIAQVGRIHSGGCDLGSPHSPSATLAIARARGGLLEYLVLCDSTVLLDHRDGTAEAVTDDRLDLLRPRIATPPEGADPLAYERLGPVERFAAHRNRPGGFWVAAADPLAARQALTGAVPLDELRSVSLLTDGATRLADLFATLSWPDLRTILTTDGPAGLIRRTRKTEAATPPASGKPSDDATALHWPLTG